MNIGRAVSARAVRGLQGFIDAKGYEALGYDNLTTFLNESPDSPMTKSQYYDRLAVLEQEGDVTFDLLNNLCIPVAARKLLTDGQVRIEGDNIIIGEESFPATDRARVKEAIKVLAQQVETSKETIKKGEKEVTKLKKKIDEDKQSASYLAAPFDQALMNLLGSFTALVIEVEELPPHARQEKLDYTLKQIANQRLRLEEAFNLTAPELSEEERQAGLADVIDELDLDGM